MIIARVVGMTVGLVVGLSGWLLEWESYYALFLLTGWYLLMTIAAHTSPESTNWLADALKDLMTFLRRMHAKWFFAGAWVMALALAPLQCI